jgi:hypothetical protein
MREFNKVQLVTTRWFDAREKNTALNTQSRCVCALFAHLMKVSNIRLPEGRGLIMEYGPDLLGNPHIYSNGWHTLVLTTDIRNFLNLKGLEKKNYFMNLILDGFEILNTVLPVPLELEPVHKIAKEMAKTEYLNRWVWSAGTKSSPSRKLKSNIFISHEMDHFEVILQLLNKSKEIIFDQTKVMQHPQEFIIDSVLGKLQWVSESEISIESKLLNHPPVIFSGWVV